jgi:hypothetical protein
MVGPRKGASVSFGEHSTERYPWYVTGCIDWPIVRALLLAVTPLQSEAGNWRQSITLDKQKALDIWYCDVTYGPIQPPDPSTWQWEYDAAPESIHVTASKQCIQVYSTGPVPDAGTKNAIGDNGHDIEGCEIQSSSTTWSEQHQLWATAVPFGYGDKLSSLLPFTNQASFRGYAAGRVLFLGGNLKRSSKDPEWIDASYKFKLAKQLTVSIGPISGIVVPPHHVVDCKFQQDVDATAHELYQKLLWVKIHRVYDPGDLSQLGIGS